jgi:purine-binding chemotaxis protein CheW
MSMPGQLTTFRIDANMYGIDVQVVQEVTKGMVLTPVPLAPPAVAGLLNLRGQIATAISLRKLFQMPEQLSSADRNFIICRLDSLLMALVVDEIGDVIDVDAKNFEDTPETMPSAIKNFSRGVYKLDNDVLTLFDIEKIIDKINKAEV